jgi:hypothetical protein
VALPLFSGVFLTRPSVIARYNYKLTDLNEFEKKTSELRKIDNEDWQ